MLVFWNLELKKDARSQSPYPVCSQVQKGGCYEVLAPGMDGSEKPGSAYRQQFLKNSNISGSLSVIRIRVYLAT